MVPRRCPAALVSLLALGCARAAAPPAPASSAGACSVDAVAWLAGTWASADGDESTAERWRRDGEHRLVGESVTTRGGERVFGERLEIACVDGMVVYTAWPEGQAMARFPATVLDRSGAVFENPAHDFPTRIEYRRDGDALSAEVSGEVDGAMRVESWRFRREDAP